MPGIQSFPRKQNSVVAKQFLTNIGIDKSNTDIPKIEPPKLKKGTQIKGEENLKEKGLIKNNQEETEDINDEAIQRNLNDFEKILN